MSSLLAPPKPVPLAPPAGHDRLPVAWLTVFGLVLLYAFLLALDLLTRSASVLAGPILGQVVKIAGSPLMGVCLGLLATATVQSSSAVTSFLVAFVSAGAITLEQAVPMVLGANIGTTFTALLVSLSHIAAKKEFRKGITVGLQHNFFNLGACLVALPLESEGHLLSRASEWAARLLGSVLGTQGAGVGGVISVLVSPVTQAMLQRTDTTWLWAGVGLSLLFGCILLFRTTLRIFWMGDGRRRLSQQVFGSPWRALGLGTGLTAFIHSSTVTTSLCVPIAATGAVAPRRLLPFIVGANIGTTVTALIAALGRSEAALALAFSHLIFNLTAGLLVMGLPPVNRTLALAARATARLFAERRSLALLFLVAFFFALPLGVIVWGAR